MRIITLTTDFGLSDPFVGVMKGVILSIAPEARLIDLSHQIPPQDILAAALALESAVDYFPSGTIHLAVVDPGVGSVRKAVAIETESAVFIGPDNGIFTLALAGKRIRRIFTLENSLYRLPNWSATFHGRDIFAPAAAHLAAGVDLSQLGPPAQTPVQLEIAEPECTESELRGIVLTTDHFGNLISSITESAFNSWLAGTQSESVEVALGDSPIRPIGPIRRTFTDSGPGTLLAYIGSGRRVEIAMNLGSAAVSLRAGRGLPIRITR